MKNSIVILFSLFCFALASCGGSSNKNQSNKMSSDSTNVAAVYVCPMDSDVRSDKPGKCPKCGMDLEKKD
jgi:hypothetical protein